MYGYNVYDIREIPALPIFCKDYEEVEKIILSDPERYVVRKRLTPEDDDCLDGKE